MKLQVEARGMELELDANRSTEGWKIETAEQDYDCNIEQVQEGVFSLLINHRSFLVSIGDSHSGQVNVNGRPFQITILDEIHVRLRELGWTANQEEPDQVIRAQIPGLITRIFPRLGDRVEPGQPLFLMEAMKMENEIKAPHGGIVKQIFVDAGETVEKGITIIEIVTEEGAS